MKITNLAATPFDHIMDAFFEVFREYDSSFSKIDLMKIAHLRGFDPSLSFAVFDGDKIVAFILNGIGEYDGKRICYDCAIGTIPAYRDRGLAGKLFRHAIRILEEADVEQNLIEGLQNNDSVIALYTGKNNFDL